MERLRRTGNAKSVWVIAVMMVSLVCGCSHFKDKPSSASATDAGASPKYYDFGDVLVPEELSVDKDDSFIVKTPGFSAGVIIAKGRVERNSLINFFENNMVKDNWPLVASFKSPRTMMLFHKENRWCVISITDRNLEYNTHIEIWVAPSIDGFQPGGMTESAISN